MCLPRGVYRSAVASTPLPGLEEQTPSLAHCNINIQNQQLPMYVQIFAPSPHTHLAVIQGQTQKLRVSVTQIVQDEQQFILQQHP